MMDGPRGKILLDLGVEPMTSSANLDLDLLRAQRCVAIIRVRSSGPSSSAAPHATLVDSGIGVLEFPLTTPGVARACCAPIIDDLGPGAQVGTGSVTTVEQAQCFPSTPGHSSSSPPTSDVAVIDYARSVETADPGRRVQPHRDLHRLGRRCHGGQAVPCLARRARLRTGVAQRPVPGHPPHPHWRSASRRSSRVPGRRRPRLRDGQRAPRRRSRRRRPSRTGRPRPESSAPHSRTLTPHPNDGSRPQLRPR